LADQKHREPLGEHEPQTGQSLRAARSEHETSSADTVRVGAADEIKGRLREDRGGEKHADLGIGQALAVGVQRHGEPGDAEPEIPRP
jgi:hypothetical protein